VVALHAAVDMDTPQANLSITVDGIEAKRLAENPATGGVDLDNPDFISIIVDG